VVESVTLTHRRIPLRLPSSHTSPAAPTRAPPPHLGREGRESGEGQAGILPFVPKPDAGLLAVDGAEGALSPDLALRHEARFRCTDSGAADDRA